MSKWSSFVITKKFKCLLPLITIISLFFTQTTHAFIYRVDVLAKRITLPSGEKKVVVALLGSDNHELAKEFPEVQIILIDQLSRKLEPSKKSTTKILFEGTFTSSEWCQLDDQLQQTLHTFLCSNNHKISTLQTFCLPPEILCAQFPHLDKALINGLITECIEVRQAHNIATSFGLAELLEEHSAFFDKHLSELFMKKLMQQVKNYQATTPDKDFEPIFEQLFDTYNTHLKSTFIASSQYYKNFFNEGLYGEELFAQALEDDFRPLDKMIEANALWLLSKSFTEKQNRFIVLAGGFHINPMSVNLDFDTKDEYQVYPENSVGLNSYLEIGGYTHLASLDILPSLRKGIKEISLKAQKLPESEDDYVFGECKNLLHDLATNVADFITEWTLKTDSQINTLLCPETNIIGPDSEVQHSEIQNIESKTQDSFGYDNYTTHSWCRLL